MNIPIPMDTSKFSFTPIPAKRTSINLKLLREEMLTIRRECQTRIDVMASNTIFINKTAADDVEKDEALKALNPIVAPVVYTACAYVFPSRDSIKSSTGSAQSTAQNLTYQPSPVHTEIPVPKKKPSADARLANKQAGYDRMVKTEKTAHMTKQPPASAPPRKHSAKQPQDKKRGHEDEEGDYSKPKTLAQIPLTQFYTYMEQYFRPIIEEDMRYLSYRADAVSPFLNPPQGKHYSIRWREEIEDHELRALNTDEDFTMLEGIIYPSEASHGDIWPRLLASLIPTNNMQIDTTSDRIIDIIDITAPEKINFSHLEEACVRELRFLGILIEGDVVVPDNQDDISQDLCRAQETLRGVIDLNIRRREILTGIAEDWLAYQEYAVLLEDCDKRIHAAYDKKFRSAGTKKKKTGSPGIDGTEKLVDERDMLLGIMKMLFDGLTMAGPTKSVY